MAPDTKTNRSNQPLTIRFQLKDGSVHEFTQADATINEKLCSEIEPSRLFTRHRIVVGSEHSKSVFVANEIIRVDFLHESFRRWDWPAGHSDIVELCEQELRQHTHLDRRDLMVKRNEPAPTRDMLVSFVRLQMRGGHPVFPMIEILVKLPSENHFFMQFILSKGALHMRLRGGGTGVLSLANLAAYTVYPGVAQIPSDSGSPNLYENQAHHCKNTPTKQFFASSTRRAIIRLLFRQSFLSSAMRRAFLMAFRFFECRTILTHNESQRTLLISLSEFLRADPIPGWVHYPIYQNWCEREGGASTSA